MIKVKRMWHWETGETLKKASDANYKTTDRCDDCGKEAEGLMLHTVGATGRVCPVLFLCNSCYTPGIEGEEK